ncbi:zinc ribbon domain-containing protein [Winogradskyella sp.]|uniref:zinc ribbon domain-containing protein n=1 Tax=Winogradskyella sp. TaxID=1883156 RepID=UPI0025E89780|nr:zinc ribbon domain-containing protein [Winogradskyella sp.]
MSFCTKCGQKLMVKAKFCPSCGEKILESNLEKKSQKSSENELVSNQISMLVTSDIKKINNKIELQNNQSGIIKKAKYAAVFFALVIAIAFTDLDVLSIHPAIVMLSIFLFISSLVIIYMFRSREEKSQSLITGENLLASWTLNDTQKTAYVDYLFEHEKGKNLPILIVISILSIIIFGVFILVIDEGKFTMFLVLIGLIAFVSVFAFGMPRYYKYQNSKNDGKVLIGAKFAYINGYFHNWDFMLSGLSKVKVMSTPFHGINLVYYYTDRTLKHSEELFIPANENQNLNDLVAELKHEN